MNPLRLPLAIIATLLFPAAAVVALDLPLAPSEKVVIEEIAAIEGIELAAAAKPGFSAKSAIETLAALGLPKDDLGSITVRDAASERRAITITHDAAGHVLAITGNGPWLRNEGIERLAALPELRLIRIDHNGYVGKDPRAALYDGSGFAALADSELAEIKIGLGFGDKGMEPCAKIKTLRSFTVAHSQVTEAGIAFFAGHPGLTEFSIGEMASQRVTETALAAIAKIPHLTKVGFKECYVTYAGGFAHLAPLKGQLTEIDLSMSLASAEDLAKLQADFPQAKIITLTPDEIAKRHKFIAQNLAKQAPPELAAPLKAALGTR